MFDVRLQTGTFELNLTEVTVIDTVENDQSILSYRHTKFHSSLEARRPPFGRTLSLYKVLPHSAVPYFSKNVFQG